MTAFQPQETKTFRKMLKRISEETQSILILSNSEFMASWKFKLGIMEYGPFSKMSKVLYFFLFTIFLLSESLFESDSDKCKFLYWNPSEMNDLWEYLVIFFLFPSSAHQMMNYFTTFCGSRPKINQVLWNSNHKNTRHCERRPCEIYSRRVSVTKTPRSTMNCSP